jgi:hypothetical protein
MQNEKRHVGTIDLLRSTLNALHFRIRRIHVGGAITINVPINQENGHIPEDTHSQIVRLSRAEKVIIQPTRPKPAAAAKKAPSSAA